VQFKSGAIRGGGFDLIEELLTVLSATLGRRGSPV
jgi:hypothetical protein